jgi:hypothetical protein
MLEESEQESSSREPVSAAQSAEATPALRSEEDAGSESEPRLHRPNQPQHEERGHMIDVHPPHEGIHTWKDYLLHMSTIVLGLLIAIGLEQSVEALHREHERQELRASLQRDSEKIVADAIQAQQAQTEPLLWLQRREQLVQDALAAHRRPGRLPRQPRISSAVPINPAWNAAKSSGLLSLLTQQEVQAYSELDSIFEKKQIAYDAGIYASKKLGQFESRYADPRNQGMMDLSSATPAVLDQYIDLLSETETAWDWYRVVCGFLRGGETAVMAGERDLGKIQKGEVQFYLPAY